MTRVSWETDMGEFWAPVADDRVPEFVESIEALGFEVSVTVTL